MSFYNFAISIVRGFFKIGFRVKYNNKQNLPDDSEKFIVCSNHKSNLDPPLVGCAMPFKVWFMAKEELFENKFFGKLISSLGAFPIKRGKSDFGALRKAINLATDGNHVVIFPEGGRSHGDSMRKGKMGAAMVAVKAKVNILPIGILGEYKPFSKLEVNIGKPIDLSEYFDKKLSSDDLEKITQDLLMPEISRLSGVPMKK